MRLRDLFPVHTDGRVISYAQCSEDILIARFFDKKFLGTYIDIGANHPTNDSVTKNLYDAGWYGINIEPESKFFSELLVSRERDINLKMGVSSEDGSADYFLCDSNLDLSTFDKNRADLLVAQGHEISIHDMPVRTLRTILHNNSLGRVVDLIKIDVEGHELEVIKGIDFKSVKFNLMVIEVGITKDQINKYLTTAGYAERYFDGLNVWYTPIDTPTEMTFIPPSPVLDWYHPYIYLRQIHEQHEVIQDLKSDSRCSVCKVQKK
jgi:FkbM family methyltransferase